MSHAEFNPRGPRGAYHGLWPGLGTIARARIDLGLTQVQGAQALGISERTLRKLEKDRLATEDDFERLTQRALKVLSV